MEAIKQQGNGFVHNPSCQGGHGADCFTSVSKSTDGIKGNTASRGDTMIKSLHCNTCEEVRP